MPASETVVEAFRKQAGWCRELGSPFTARLLAQAADDLAGDGPLAGRVGAWPGDPVADALALRVAGALHALVLAGADDRLAACYPPRGDGMGADLWPAVLAALAQHRDHVRRFLASPPQTNEVRRSGVLLGGFLAVARATGLPLRVLEIGASAGLNLIFDRYAYRLGEAAWGLQGASVSIPVEWRGPTPDLAAPLAVAERAGCDRAPIDLEDPDSRLRLRAYVWADQRDRLARLEGAIAEARAAALRVERADAAAWIEGRLAQPSPGRATVVFHSIVWQYLPEETRARIAGAIARRGAAATAAEPLAWLRFEPAGQEGFALTLSLWPGSTDRRLALAHPHGAWVEWGG